MNLALDYDNTYSIDPAFWDAFILSAKRAGHDIRIVTARDDRFDRTSPLVEAEAIIDVIYTRGTGKRWFVEHFVPDFHPVSVWIDDKAESILQNSPTTAPDLAKWREERGEGVSSPRDCRC